MNDTITLPREVAERILRNIEIGNKLSAGIEMRREIEAALDQPQGHPDQRIDMVPEGWKLVPVEPTKEMVQAWLDAYEGNIQTVYRAMLAAAPQPPALEQSKPCRSPYCECTAGKCTRPGFYDARHESYTHPSPIDKPRTSQEIVDQTEELAALLMEMFLHRVKQDGSHTLRDSDDPRAMFCWNIACRIQGMLTDTDPENAVAELEG